MCSQRQRKSSLPLDVPVRFHEPQLGTAFSGLSQLLSYRTAVWRMGCLCAPVDLARPCLSTFPHIPPPPCCALPTPPHLKILPDFRPVLTSPMRPCPSFLKMLLAFQSETLRAALQNYLKRRGRSQRTWAPYPQKQSGSTLCGGVLCWISLEYGCHIKRGEAAGAGNVQPSDQS